MFKIFLSTIFFIVSDWFGICITSSQRCRNQVSKHFLNKHYIFYLKHTVQIEHILHIIYSLQQNNFTVNFYKKRIGSLTRNNYTFFTTQCRSNLLHLLIQERTGYSYSVRSSRLNCFFFQAAHRWKMKIVGNRIKGRSNRITVPFLFEILYVLV